MAEEGSLSGGSTPIATLQQSLSGAYSPAVPSPLNPDSARRPSAPVAAAPRSQREKKESIKKRENAAVAAGNSVKLATQDQKVKGGGVTAASKINLKSGASSIPVPVRYNLPQPSAASFNPPAPHAWASHEPSPFFTPDGRAELRKPVECAQNTKVYKYKLAVADPLFRHREWYRATETAPFGPQLSTEDSDKLIHFSHDKTTFTNEKGWRSSRANVFAREGSLYYEAKIAKGVPSEGPAVPLGAEGMQQPHIRMGWARREASLDAPVGFDGYSYGITDIRFQTIHKSRPGKISAPAAGSKQTKVKGSKSKAAMAAAAAANQRPSKIEEDTGDEDHVRQGDVLGLLITLPSLSLHRKVADGIYNPAVDVGDGFDDSDAYNTLPNDVIRDRAPFNRGSTHYFEEYDYQPTKGMESYGDRGPFNSIRPNPNHEDPTVRCLPHSSIKVFKNGVLVGTAFENLMAFLPPCSEMGGKGNAPTKAGVGGGTDDGSLGYYPMVSGFAGGIADVNFGPDFWMPPSELQALTSSSQIKASQQDTPMVDGEHQQTQQSPTTTNNGTPLSSLDPSDPQSLTPTTLATQKRHPKPISIRYHEQIAEDVVWDIIDEASFFAQDGGYDSSHQSDIDVAQSKKGGIVSLANAAAAAAVGAGNGVDGGGTSTGGVSVKEEGSLLGGM